MKEFLGEDDGHRTGAARIGTARATVSRVLNGRTAVTVDLSIRLGQALGLSPDFFSKAQLQYDLWIELQKERGGRRLSGWLRERLIGRRVDVDGNGTVVSDPVVVGMYTDCSVVFSLEFAVGI